MCTKKGKPTTGYSGLLLGIYNVPGTGLNGTVTIDAPKIAAAITASEYKLH
jgi:hypothetical protein